MLEGSGHHHHASLLTLLLTLLLLLPPLSHSLLSPPQIQLDAQRKALEQLQANVRVLEGKLGEARNKRETLKARAASAKSSKQIQEVRELQGCQCGDKPCSGLLCAGGVV